MGGYRENVENVVKNHLLSHQLFAGLKHNTCYNPSYTCKNQVIIKGHFKSKTNRSYQSFENRDALWYCIGDRTKKSLLGNIKINFLR